MLHDDDLAGEGEGIQFQIPATVPIPTPAAIVAESIDQRIGQLMAMGCSTIKMIQYLLAEDFATTAEEATHAIRAVYTQWHDTRANLALEPDDIREWHIQMRHELLERTMIVAPRVALAVLESLASLQHVQTTDSMATEIPLTIQLIPAPIPTAAISTPPIPPTPLPTP